MKQVLLFLIKPLSFLPALLMIYLIFSFSSQDGVTSGQLSYYVTKEIVTIGGEILDKGWENWEIEQQVEKYHGLVRKLGHVTEYFFLAVAIAFPFYVYGLRGFPLLIVAGLLCLGVASADEYYQGTVAGRGPSKRDVGIDMIGAFFGIIVVRIICWTALSGSRRRARAAERRAKAKRTQK